MRFLIAAASVLPLAPTSSCMHPSQEWRREETRDFDRSEETSLGRKLSEAAAAHPGKSAVLPLPVGLDALAARLFLIESAERAIDFQYYILRRDATGEYVVARLLAAADRGVRVRILVDDLGSPGLDAWMPALGAHENVEVRYFNPFARGPWPTLARTLDGIARMRRVNHRMHNKMLAVDGAAGVVGGRNVADAYFDAAESVNFADLDLLVAGPVVDELSACFDSYWNSPYVAPVEAWSGLRREEKDLEELRAALVAHVAAHSTGKYADRLRGSDLLAELASGEVRSHWASASAVADLPEKVVARGDDVEKTLLIRRLEPHLGVPERELLVVSPYFVPGDRGVEHLTGLAKKGVRVAVLTNSLAATDVTVVHVGYKRYREALLEGGVELYELKPAGAAIEAARESGSFGSSGASLHAKTFLFDRRRVFVGSLNLDPRSVDLNTELGIVVESEPLAADVAERFARGISPELSWRLSLDEGGDLVWESTDGSESRRETSEPDTSLGRKIGMWFLGWLPIENQL